MGRRKIFACEPIPRSVTEIVRAICADYPRRQRMISDGEGGDAEKECRRINAAVDAALAEVEVGVREILLLDIACGRGYDYSMASAIMVKSSYYRRRNKLIRDIARQMNLL